jgi:sulfur dioxygenase
MIFRQWLEPLSSTYTYLLGCEQSHRAVLIDPVINRIDHDLEQLQRLGLALAYAIDTHIHADHITAALELKQRVGSRIAQPAMDHSPCVDVLLEEGKPLNVGSIRIDPMHTPGHTAGHFAYALADRVFTGDCLLIDGCGRTDFQNGDSRALYHSVTQKLFALPDDVLVYPGHDYQNRHVSTIAQEKARNPRLGQNRSLDSFVELMAQLQLPYPRFIDYAVPGNRACGVCPVDLPEQLAAYCQHMSQSRQG